jgi:hypothetical protein
METNKILLWVKSHFFLAVIAILTIIIFFQTCGKDSNNPYTLPIIKTDTVWVETKKTVFSKPIVIKSIPGEPEIKYIPDPNYEKLVLQYKNLVKDYTAQNIQKDSIKIDDIGYVNIIDTVSNNFIIGRKTSYSLKYPTITNTITLPPLNKTQVYYGGGIQLQPNAYTTAVNAGLLLKTKKDHIYNAYIGVNNTGSYQIGIQTYWKFKLRK